MSTAGSGGPNRRSTPRFGWGAGRRGARPTPSPPPSARPGWRPKGSPQKPSSAGGSGGPGTGTGGPPRRTPPSRGAGSRPKRGGTPAPADQNGTPGQGNERRRLPKQLLPGGLSRGAGNDQDQQNGGGSGSDQSGTRGGWSMPGAYTAVDYFMMLPGFAVAYYGGQLVRDCAVEVNGMAAFALWLMIGFWVTLATARWPTFRMLRWAWVLAGVLGAIWTPG